MKTLQLVGALSLALAVACGGGGIPEPVTVANSPGPVPAPRLCDAQEELAVCAQLTSGERPDLTAPGLRMDCTCAYDKSWKERGFYLQGKRYTLLKGGSEAQYRTPLWLAVEAGLDDTIEGLVAVGAHPNQRDARPTKEGFRLDELPMNHAISEREWDAIEALVKQGASLDGLTIATGDPRTLLTLAVNGAPPDQLPAPASASAQEATALLALGLSPDAKTMHGHPWIRAACTDPEVTRLLIDAGANLNATTPEGKTALHQAATAKNKAGLRLEAARLLLAAGADPALTDEDGKSPRKLAEGAGFDEMVTLLAEFGG